MSIPSECGDTSNHNDTRTSQLSIESPITTRDVIVPEHSAPPEKLTIPNDTTTEPKATENSLKRRNSCKSTGPIKKAKISADTETSEDAKTYENTKGLDSPNKVLGDDDLVYLLFAIHVKAVMRVERRRFYRVKGLER
ncbi:unnamed protein product [Fusarium venenatum]|uniref:Uncharacterized protein n=1 Tax=Fusarium venenatum TaxID=56646 RepID=A0A2L2TGN6_9HYPO|nr:uncharacterized protein FVRRES_09345 [Fusarium venenatum]CEI69268.1 unnamed protein product [Fusarium venenatum]